MCQYPQAKMLPSDQNASILLVTNMDNGNIVSLWHRKSCMRKTSKSVPNLCEYWSFFLCDLLGTKSLNTPNSHTIVNIKNTTFQANSLSKLHELATSNTIP